MCRPRLPAPQAICFFLMWVFFGLKISFCSELFLWSSCYGLWLSRKPAPQSRPIRCKIKLSQICRTRFPALYWVQLTCCIFSFSWLLWHFVFWLVVVILLVWSFDSQFKSFLFVKHSLVPSKDATVFQETTSDPISFPSQGLSSPASVIPYPTHNLCFYNGKLDVWDGRWQTQMP